MESVWVVGYSMMGVFPVTLYFLCPGHRHPHARFVTAFYNYSRTNLNFKFHVQRNSMCTARSAPIPLFTPPFVQLRLSGNLVVKTTHISAPPSAPTPARLCRGAPQKERHVGNKLRIVAPLKTMNPIVRHARQRVGCSVHPTR